MPASLLEDIQPSPLNGATAATAECGVLKKTAIVRAVQDIIKAACGGMDDMRIRVPGYRGSYSQLTEAVATLWLVPLAEPVILTAIPLALVASPIPAASAIPLAVLIAIVSACAERCIEVGSRVRICRLDANGDRLHPRRNAQSCHEQEQCVFDQVLSALMS